MLPLERNPVTLDDLQAMFKLFSGADGHKREKDDIPVWETAAHAARWTRAEVAAAALTIASTWTGFRIMPGHVTAQIAADREQIRKLWYCPDPPRALRDDPAAEIAWRRRACADFADRALLALATGQQLAEVPLLREIEPEPVSALPAGEQSRRVERMAEVLGSRKAIPAAPRGERGVPAGKPRRARLDDDARRAVRAELDARAAASSGKDGQEEDWAPVVDHEVAV